MLSWWSSIESVSKFNSTLQLFIAFSAIITASLGLLIWLSSHQLTKLRNDKEIKEQTRLSTTEQETSKLRDELKIAKGHLNASERTIENLNTETKLAQEKIANLTIEAKKAARGISSTYDFKGVKRDIAPGRINAIIGEETEVFAKMFNLEKEKKYSELSSLCKKQISKTPEWLTPYLFLGIAEANMGNKDDAISNFEYVIANAPDDPDYKQAKEFIKMLKK